jgi:hypothetical protein
MVLSYDILQDWPMCQSPAGAGTGGWDSGDSAAGVRSAVVGVEAGVILSEAKEA